jgi:hypothetical protein
MVMARKKIEQKKEVVMIMETNKKKEGKEVVGGTFRNSLGWGVVELWLQFI